MTPRRGFSLIELAVVMAILAIVAGVVVLRMHGPRQAVAMQDVLDRLASLDRLARLHARGHDQPLRIVVDPASGVVRRVEAKDGQAVGVAVALPPGYRIQSVRVGADDPAGTSASIGVSRHGLSASYAVAIEGPAGQRKWMLIAGLTGEVTVWDDATQVRDILDAIQGGHDAG